MFLRAVCCSDTQGWLGFPWPPKRGWAKRCATLPWPLSGWSLQFLFFLLTPRSLIRVSGCQVGAPLQSNGEGAVRPALDAGANGDYIASPSRRKNSSGQTQARAAPPSVPAPVASQAMGSLPLRPDPAAQSPTSPRRPPARRSAHHHGGDVTEQPPTRTPQAPVCAYAALGHSHSSYPGAGLTASPRLVGRRRQGSAVPSAVELEAPV
jgi:hypothetical protein